MTSAVGIAPKYLISPAWARDGLAPGMTGGPTGFPGAERYQYNEGMSEGRAIEGIKKLKAEGKAPSKLSLLLTDGAIGLFKQPFPEGAPTVAEVWERETGIEIDIIGASAADIWTKVLQDVVTGSGAYDMYAQPWNSIGDLVAAGGAYNLDEFVAKYQPDWGDPARGAPTPQIADLLYKYDGSYYTVSLDGDFQTWVYRTDLFNDPGEQAAYEAQYGSALGHPKTWQDVDQISAHFKRPELNGHTNLLSPFWGLSIFYARYVSKAKPNLYFFDDDGNPLLDTDQGIQAAEEHVNSLQHASADALSWTWAEAYGSMANLGSTMISTYTNIAKFNDRMNADGTPATPLTGNLGSFLPPGTAFGNDLVRRSVLYYNINAEVASQSQYPEAAYLFLQWASSTRTFSWMSGNPGGYFDPFQIANFEDPLVNQTYHSYHTPIIQETIKRSAPTINYAGQTAFDNALDEQLQAALVGEISAADAMRNASKAWRKIIKKKGENKMVQSIRDSKAAWPTIIDQA